ncbi:hypothetical protein DAT35_20490 [Vitiosangium sp. GDMCC 1.1324]|nr:hypothetical protein DAT35_20490 [Vitiosangium sp. GDMCC 1.1324]
MNAACATTPPQPPPPTARETLTRRIDEAVALRTQGRQEEGIQQLSRIRFDAYEANEPALAALALHRKGDLLHDLGRDVPAGQAYVAALVEYEVRGDLMMIGRAAHDLGVLEGGGREAERWYRRAREARLEAGDKAGLRVTDNNLAITLFYQSRFDEAEALYLESAGIAEEIGDHLGAFKAHGNLALLHAIVAEGGFPSEQGPVPKVDPTSGHVKQGREHFAKAIAAGARMGKAEEDACAQLGRYDNRCEWLSPGSTPEKGVARFYVRLISEVEVMLDEARDEREALDEESEPEQVTEAEDTLLVTETLLAAALTRAADALRAAGPVDEPSTRDIEQYEQRARTVFTNMARRLTETGGTASELCGLYASTSDLCSRYPMADEKPRKAIPDKSPK